MNCMRRVGVSVMGLRQPVALLLTPVESGCGRPDAGPPSGRGGRDDQLRQTTDVPRSVAESRVRGQCLAVVDLGPRRDTSTSVRGFSGETTRGGFSRAFTRILQDFA